MLRRAVLTVSTRFRKLMMAENTVAQAVTSEDVGEKRPLKDETSCPPAKKLKTQQAAPMQGRADRKRKVALLIAYCGAGYYGIQIQMKGDFKTIESEVIKALLEAELIPQDHADTPSKMSLQRAARTDKSVSAVGNVLSLKMLYQDGVSDKINCHLPPEIRVIGCVRTTNGFDSKNHCTARTYKYMLPTYSFAPVEKFLTKDYRLPEGILTRVNEVLGKYVGTHNFHNFTSGRKPNDPSSKRYIISFECGEPFEREGMEFVILTVKGQSFMLHHIRKMIGLMIAIVRGFCGEEVLVKSWGPHKMDIPKAPGLGLFLQELFFAGYNKKFGNDGIHQPLVWDKYQESLEKFKEEHVLSHIARSELKESVMLQWLGTLQYHKFDTIDPSQEVPPDGEKEKDPTWWKTKALLRKLDREQTGTEAGGEHSTDPGLGVGVSGGGGGEPGQTPTTITSTSPDVKHADNSTTDDQEEQTPSSSQETSAAAATTAAESPADTCSTTQHEEGEEKMEGLPSEQATKMAATQEATTMAASQEATKMPATQEATTIGPSADNDNSASEQPKSTDATDRV